MPVQRDSVNFLCLRSSCNAHRYSWRLRRKLLHSERPHCTSKYCTLAFLLRASGMYMCVCLCVCVCVCVCLLEYFSRTIHRHGTHAASPARKFPIFGLRTQWNLPGKCDVGGEHQHPQYRQHHHHHTPPIGAERKMNKCVSNWIEIKFRDPGAEPDNRSGSVDWWRSMVALPVPVSPARARARQPCFPSFHTTAAFRLPRERPSDQEDALTLAPWRRRRRRGQCAYPRTGQF